MDCDLVVLGAGGSGLVAAVKAYDMTGKKVIVLEKAKKLGGAANFAHGALDFKDSKWHKEAGYEVSDPPDITGRFFDWLVSKGGAESFFKIAKPFEKSREDIYMPARLEKYKDMPDPSIGPGWLGSYVINKMVECCKKAGITILTEAPARKFITDDNGKVTGVLADTTDGQLLVNCKACIIAAGGFGSNYERLKKYWPEDYNNKKIHFLCPPGMMGDGLDMAEEIGAYIDRTKWGFNYPGGFFTDGPGHHPYSYTINSFIGNGMLPSINLDGKRWRNEGGFGGDASIRSQPGAVAYAVADDEIIETLGPKLVERADCEADVRILSNYRADIEYEAAIDEEGASGNHTKKADTFAELALKMKVDPRTFVETMERYNRFCDNGKDLDFGKPAQFLKPIRKPPFYAFFGHRWSQCTKGRNGIAVNPRFEVLNAKGEAIPGLYAVGDGCTIYGGLVLVKQVPMGVSSRGRAAGSSAISGDGGDQDAAAKGAGAPVAGVQGGPSGGASAAGGPVGAGGAPGAAGVAKKNILDTDPSPCGCLNAALYSGYYAGMYIADYFKIVNR